MIRALLCLMLLGISGGSAGAVMKSNGSSQPLQERAMGTTEWQVLRNPRDQSVNVLRSRTTLSFGSVRTRGDQERAGEDFFRATGPVYGLRPGIDEMVLNMVLEHGDMRFLKFEQLYKGIPVLNGGVTVAMDGSGVVHMASGSPTRGIDLETTSAVTLEQATAEYGLRRGRNAQALVASKPLVIAQIDGRPTLCYRVTEPNPGGPSPEILIE